MACLSKNARVRPAEEPKVPEDSEAAFQANKDQRLTSLWKICTLFTIGETCVQVCSAKYEYEK